MKKLLPRLLQSAFLALLALPAFFLCGCSDGDPGTLNSRGIPKQSIGIAHFNLVAAQKSELAQAIQKKWSEKARQSARADYDAFKAETGFDPEKDISSITMGMFPLKNKGDKDAAAIITILRGKYSPEKLQKYIAAKELYPFKGMKTHKVGTKDVLVDDDGAICFFDDKTAFVVNTYRYRGAAEQAHAELAADVIAALGDKSKSYEIPQSLFDLEKKLPKPAILVHADIAKSPQVAQILKEYPMAEPFQPISAQIGVAETNGQIKTRVLLQYDTADKAKGVQALANMGRNEGKKQLAKNDPDELVLFKNALEKVKLEADGTTFTAEATLPVSELITLLNKNPF